MKRVTGWAIAVAMSIGFAGTANAGIAIGDAAPDALGRTPSGQEIKVSDNRGKVVVVAFWASWCGYCRKELPVLAGLQEAAGKERLEVVAVDYQDDRDVYRALTRKLADVQLTLTHDGNGAIGKRYGVAGLPRLLMLDRQGKVAYIHVGYGDDSLDRIVAAVNALLAAKPEPAGA